MTDRPALTHIDAQGEARMVDVSDKPATERVAVAEGRVIMSPASAGQQQASKRMMS